MNPLLFDLFASLRILSIDAVMQSPLWLSIKNICPRYTIRTTVIRYMHNKKKELHTDRHNKTGIFLNIQISGLHFIAILTSRIFLTYAWWLLKNLNLTVTFLTGFIKKKLHHKLKRHLNFLHRHARFSWHIQETDYVRRIPSVDLSSLNYSFKNSWTTR